jgi:outer membrane protein insertion porin family
LPLISDTNTIKNYYNYSHYFDFFEKNFSSISIYLQSANSLSNKNIKLSERLSIPSSRLRGFEAGRIGPKDGDDFVGGNYGYSINFASNVPQLFEDSQNIDFLIFADAANLWGVDYNSSIGGEGIRSSVGVALDWMSPIGPMNFTLAYPVTKKNGDITETFRFNLGTTF